MTSQEAIDRVRQKLDQTDASNSFFSDAEIIDEVNAARRELARLLPKSLFPKLIKSAPLTVTNGTAALPTDYLDIYPTGYTLIDGVQAKAILPQLLPNLQRNLNTAPDETNKYYFIEAGIVYCFPTNSQSVTFQYYGYPTDLKVNDSTDVNDLPEDVNDLAIDLAFANLNNSERGDLNIAQIARASVIDKVNALIQTLQGK